MTDFSSLQLKVDDLKAKVEQNSITPPYLGAILDAIIELMAAIDISDRETDISTALSNSKTALSSLNALTPQVSANKSAIDALTPRLGAAEGAINTETSERQTADAALQEALEALKTRVTTAEGGIATNSSDIATLQDDLQSVAQALNALSGSGDTTAVIDTFNEVVDFLEGVTNNEKLTGKLDELRNLCQDNYEDIGRLKENVSQITQIVDENRELQNSQAEAIESLQGGLGEAQNELGELSQLLVDYEDDAALKLSEAEMRLGKRIDGVGILPFNTIVEAHHAVIDGTPSYESQFPSAADGAYRHIIFDKSRRTFLWEIHAGDYPNCPAGDAYSAWTGSEEYLSEGHPRADRLYRMGNELYRWDGEALKSHGEELAAKADRTELSNIVGTPSDDVIEDLEPTLVTEALRKTAQTLTPAEQAQVKKNIGVSKMELFIDMWNAEGSYCHKSHASHPITAKYDPENAPDMAHPFVCNGLWLTYVEALDVYNHRLTRGTIRTGALRVSHVRTALCAIHSIYAEEFSLDSLFYGATNLEIARISTNDPQGIWVNDMTCTFSGCRKLREIVPTIVDVVKANKYPAWMNTFNMCDSLVSVKIKGLTHSLVFSDSPLLSLDSISFMVTNAANTSPITITVHKDVFAKLTDEANTEWNQVLTDATNKNITFATL